MNNKTKSESSQFREFIESQKSLSNEEMVFNSGKLIKRTKAIDVDKAYSTVQKQLSSKIRMISIYTTVSRYAAILVLPLIIFSIWSTLKNNKIEIQEAKQEFSIQEVNCPVGMRSKLILPDGTRVWLNAKSSIKYSLPFVNDERSVELNGEAYLEVAKNKKIPFNIRSGKVKVEVLGTQFNFKSYPDDKTVEVALKEGSINLNLISQGNKTSSTQMVPGDYFVFDKTTEKATITNKNLDNYFAWKKNIIVFDETPMLKMKQILERWYGVEIEITNKTIESYKFTATIDNEPLNQVLELLEISSPVRLEYIPAKFNKKLNKTTKAKIRILDKSETNKNKMNDMN